MVALPLALAFGVASGAGPVAGLHGAIFVGPFAALFGGTPAQVSGPTGPMTVVMAGILTQFSHAPALAFTVAMMAGLFLTIFVDPITAVAVGIVLASLLFVKRVSDLPLANIKTITDRSDEALPSGEEKSVLTEAQGRIVLYHLSGPFSFGAAKGMARRLAAAGEYDALVLDLAKVPALDSSASLALEDAIAQAQGRAANR